MGHDVDHNWIEPYDPNLSVDERIARLDRDCRNVEDAHREDSSVRLSDSDYETLDKAAHDDDPRVRLVAVEFLAVNGLCRSYEQFESWLMDPDEEVRQSVDMYMDTLAFRGEGLSSEQKAYYAEIMIAAAEHYLDYYVINVTWDMLARFGEGWFEVLWEQAGKIIDRAFEESVGHIECGFLESVIHDRQLGLSDPPIASWVNGDKSARKISLMNVAEWTGWDNLYPVVQALANDKDPVVAERACRMLGTRYADSSGDV